jgi:hypothetical protein
VAKTERLLLAGKARRARRREFPCQKFYDFAPLPTAKRTLQFDLAIEMVLDDVLITPCDKDEVLDAGFAGFIDDVLDERPVNDRQHFLRHCLSGWEKSGAEACDREDGLADRVHRNFAIERYWRSTRC